MVVFGYTLLIIYLCIVVSLYVYKEFFIDAQKEVFKKIQQIGLQDVHKNGLQGVYKGLEFFLYGDLLVAYADPLLGV